MAEAQLPKTYKRLVAKHTGTSFSEVATVQEWDLKSPEEGKVELPPSKNCFAAARCCHSQG